jgi:hypothetical protein
MKAAVKNKPTKRKYKVFFLIEGDPKVKHLDYVWAESAREAEEIVRNKTRKGDGKIIKVKAGALG